MSPSESFSLQPCGPQFQDFFSIVLVQAAPNYRCEAAGRGFAARFEAPSSDLDAVVKCAESMSRERECVEEAL